MHQQRESVIQGVPNIAKVTGLEQRQVYYMLERGLLKGAVQIGSRWYITAGNLFANFRPKGEVEIELRTLLDQMPSEDLQELLRYWELWIGVE